jgi:hypothetical protein
MKIKIRSDDASMLQEHDWSQVGDWLAELRDGSRAELPGDGHAGADGADDPWAAARARAGALAEARAQVRARAQAEAHAQAQAAARTRARARSGATGLAVIGDRLRMPVMWCEMGSCISWYTDPAALGEADTRARAIGAGWRIDALGRLACPQCQQSDPRFWTSCPVVPWDRDMAITRAARAATPGDGTAGGPVAGGISRAPGRAASGYPPASRPGLEWHHDSPASASGPAAWS